ncbi:MAG: hypothetical protein JW768_12395 [Chitinispirillaceae bacterium]|nr:hypothetical protein [Chitinispirillaceae bacterium]
MLVSPTNGAAVGVDSILLVWRSAGETVNGYCLECAADSLMTNPVVDSAITDTMVMKRQLVDATTYWWRVRAQNGAGWGPYSTAAKFTVNFSTHAGQGETLRPGAWFSCRNGRIVYTLHTASRVTITLVSLRGQTVFSFEQALPAGTHEFPRQISCLSPGTYFAHLKAADREKRIIVPFFSQ